MGDKELAAALGVDLPKLRRWCQAGLPRTRIGKKWQYDSRACVEWLIQHGHAKREVPPAPRLVASTYAEVANHFGVNVRTVAGWSKQGMPGQVFGSGRKGCFDLEAIAEWLDSKGLGEQAGKLKSEYLQERIRERRLKNGQLEGTLIDRQAALTELRRTLSFVRSVLTRLPKRMLARLPSKLPASERKAIEAAWEQEIANCARTLAAGPTDGSPASPDRGPT